MQLASLPILVREDPGADLSRGLPRLPLVLEELRAGLPAEELAAGLPAERRPRQRHPLRGREAGVFVDRENAERTVQAGIRQCHGVLRSREGSCDPDKRSGKVWLGRLGHDGDEYGQEREFDSESTHCVYNAFVGVVFVLGYVSVMTL